MLSVGSAGEAQRQQNVRQQPGYAFAVIGIATLLPLALECT